METEEVIEGQLCFGKPSKKLNFGGLHSPGCTLPVAKQGMRSLFIISLLAGAAQAKYVQECDESRCFDARPASGDSVKLDCGAAVGGVFEAKDLCSARDCEVLFVGTLWPHTFPVFFFCVRQGDTIGSINLASYGQQDPSSSWSCGLPVSEFTALPACAATNSRSVVARCLDEEECTLSLDDFSGGLTGCDVNATQQLYVQVTCDAPGFDPLSILSLAFIAMIGLALGTTLDLADFYQVLKSQKKGVAIGWASQFGFMPLFAFLIAKGTGMDVLAATGLVMCGCAPGGSTSNLFTYWSRGDVALSITMSALSTLCALGMYPLLVFVYVTTGLDAGDVPEVPFVNILISLVLIMVPAACGVLIRNKCTERMLCGKHIYEVVEKVGSVGGVIFLIAALYIGVTETPDLFDMSKYWEIWVISAAFQPAGCVFGFM